jgi:hypothetical protein
MNEFLKSIISSIDTSSNSAVGFYNEILGLESSVLANVNQINKVIQTLSFVQGVQNAMLKGAILKVQDKYTVTTAVIVDLTNKRRDYLSKMMSVVENKQKILQQIAMHTISQARNPLSGIVKDLTGNRDLLALLRAYYQQSANFMKFQDAREVVNHRLNTMYSMLSQLQSEFIRAVQDYMEHETVVRVDNLVNANRMSFKRMTDLEGSLVSTEEALLTAETDLSVKLGFPGVMVDMIGGSGYVDRLVQAFTEIAGGQDGGAIDQTRVALLPNVVPRLNDVDMVSFGGIINDRLAQCQRAYSLMAQRNENQGDYNTLELALLTGKDANKTLAEIVNNTINYSVSMGNIFKFRETILGSGLTATTMGTKTLVEARLKRLLNALNKTDVAVYTGRTGKTVYLLFDPLFIGIPPATGSGLTGDTQNNNIDAKMLKSFVSSMRDRILHDGRTSASKDEKDYAFSDSAKDISKKIDEAVDQYVKNYVAPTVTPPILMTGGKKRRSAKKSSGKRRSAKKSSGKRRGGAVGGKKKRSAKKSSGKRRGGAVGGKKKRSSKKRSSGRKH